LRLLAGCGPGKSYRVAQAIFIRFHIDGVVCARRFPVYRSPAGAWAEAFVGRAPRPSPLRRLGRERRDAKRGLGAFETYDPVPSGVEGIWGCKRSSVNCCRWRN
jgi:hypothetical protein